MTILLELCHDLLESTPAAPSPNRLKASKQDQKKQERESSSSYTYSFLLKVVFNLRIDQIKLFDVRSILVVMVRLSTKRTVLYIIVTRATLRI